MNRREALFALGAVGALGGGGLSSPASWAAGAKRAKVVATPGAQKLDLAQARALHARWAGRPFVLHAWGLHCPACVKGLPGWRDTLATTPELPLLLLQVDAVPDPVVATVERLQQVGLVARESWTVVDELDEFTRHALDPQWLGETPFTLLSSPGGRVERVRGPVSREVVLAWWRRSQG